MHRPIRKRLSSSLVPMALYCRQAQAQLGSGLALACSGLMKPDTHLGENARHGEVSDDQATSSLPQNSSAKLPACCSISATAISMPSVNLGWWSRACVDGSTSSSKSEAASLRPARRRPSSKKSRINRLEREKSILKNRLPGTPRS